MRKKFDRVRFQRKARRKLGAKYPPSRSSQLMRDQEHKYGHLRKRKALQSAPFVIRVAKDPIRAFRGSDKRGHLARALLESRREDARRP